MYAKRWYSRGFFWVYREDYDAGFRPRRKKNGEAYCRPVLRFDKEGNFLGGYPSSTAGHKAFSPTRGTLSDVLNVAGKTAYGFRWSWAF